MFFQSFLTLVFLVLAELNGLSNALAPQVHSLSVRSAAILSKSRISNIIPLNAQKTKEEEERQNELLAEIDDTARIAEEAMKEAEMAIEKGNKEQELQSDALFSGIGGIAFGALGGILVDIYSSVTGDFDVDPGFPPVVLVLALGGAGFSFGSKDNVLGVIVRATLGNPVKNISTSITSSINTAVNEAVEDITAIPRNAQSAVENKAKEKVDEISEIANRVKDEAVEAATKAQEAALDATKKVTDEIKAVPKKVSEGTKKAVNRKP